jgi:hypothetical protein
MRSARNEMAQLVHQKSVAEYTAKWRELVTRLGWRDQTMLMANYFEGLKDRVKSALMMLEQDPADLEALIRQAMRIDAAQYVSLKAAQGVSSNFKKGPPQKQQQKNATPAFQYAMNDQGKWETTGKQQTEGQSFKVKQEQISAARGPLSPMEKQRRMQNGLCLYCAEKGHLAAQCPHKRDARINELAAETTPHVTHNQAPITNYFTPQKPASTSGQYAQRAPLPPNEAFYTEDF